MLAKYPRELRFKWYLWVEKHHHSVTEACKLFGVNRKIYYYWYLKDHGLKANDYRPRLSHPNLKLTKEIRQFIESQKLLTNYGPLKMKLLVKKKLGIDLSTTIIYRYFKRKKLIRRPQRKLPWYEPMKEKLTITGLGQGVQLDVKYVYSNGKREYQFSTFDPFTKKYYFTVFPTKESKNAILAFIKARKYFGFEILSIQTDNGSEFRGVFHQWLTKRNITHYFIPKKSPWWNANVERIHRTIDEEYYHNPQRTWQSVYEWLHFYNFQRIHLSLNGLTPQEKLESVTIKC